MLSSSSEAYIQILDLTIIFFSVSFTYFFTYLKVPFLVGRDKKDTSALERSGENRHACPVPEFNSQ